jgi:hypothetical protein
MINRTRALAITGIMLCCLLAAPVFAATQGAPPANTQQFSDIVYSESFKALFVLFVIATILESGLAVLFNWRPFIQLFDGRGIRSVVSVVFAYIFVSNYQLDIVTRLVNTYGSEKFAFGFAGEMITALVIAGGSSGVNTLLVSLGFRSLKSADQITPKPPAHLAWIAVRLIRKEAKGIVTVLIGPTGADLPVAGTIAGSSRTTGLLRFFLRDYGRFPTAGGFPVTPGATLYEVQLVGSDGKRAKWGPLPVAAGAIVDMDLTL